MLALLLAAAVAAPKAAPRLVPDTSATPARELEDFLRAQERWAAEAAEYRQDVQLLIERKYEDKRAALSDSYEAQLRELEDDERLQRKDAIERFARFVERYPDEPRYTPDAMFRLAELYFEEAKDNQRLAQRDYEETLRGLPSGEEPPPEPKVAFEKSIALYGQLIAKFPQYKLLDAVYYLLAYVLDQQGDPDAAREIFAEVIQRFPQSHFVPEAWMRIGEHYFDTTDEDATAALLSAAKAYGHVLERPDHPLYDKALYKLGWTWYRLDKYDDAVSSFIKLIDYYEGKEAGSAELRAEALQYTAVSFADEQWGGVEKAQAFLTKLGGRSWEPELFHKLGDIYFDQSKHTLAIEAYRVVLSKSPNAPDAPLIQQRLVQAYERDREFDKAWKERDLLVKKFSEESPWFQINKTNPDVIAKTRQLMERSIYSSAVFHHQQAQAYKKAGKLDLALREYQQATLAYGTYLQRFPHAKNLYESQFYYAETLYNSLQFTQAAGMYARVRDDQTDGRYLNESAYAVVLSLQHEADRLERAGKLQTPVLRKAADRPEGSKIDPQEVPDLLQQQIAASDLFVRLLPKDDKAPELAYRSAEIYYRFDQFDEARKRFAAVLLAFPGSEVAEYASNLTLETYLAEKDWQRVEEFSAERLKGVNGKLNPKRRAELSGISVGARFKRAQALLDAKKYEEAAKLFLAVVDDDPHVEFADKALNNAAFCYQQELRYDSALRLYERLFTQYPKSPLADTALFLVGFSAEKSFDFDKAIKEYEKLVENYPQSQKRADALYNEAHALERLQRYAEAQKAYARYAKLFPDKPDAPAMLFQGALVAERTKDYKQEIVELTDFIKRFHRNEKQGERVVQSYLKIGLAFQKLGSEASARQSFTDACFEFDRRKFGAQDALAAASAAEARFNLAEQTLLGYDRIRIEAHGQGNKFEKSLKAALNKKAEEREKVLAQYRDVAVKYKRPDWIVAALYRVGYIDERFSAALTEAPVPPELKKLGEEYVAQYQDTLSQASIPIDERALSAYKKAIETARELKIANEWTRKILESLDKYDHKSYPLMKDAKAEFLLEPLYPVSGSEGAQ
jgi:TolA-binding protein